MAAYTIVIHDDANGVAFNVMGTGSLRGGYVPVSTNTGLTVTPVS